MKLSDRLEQMVHPVLPLEIDNLLENWFGDRSRSCGSERNVFCPKTNIVERDQEFAISMELPGVPVSAVEIEASDDKLRIFGDKKIELDNETEKPRCRERLSGKFERSFEFPIQVDFENINADFQNGVLTVTVPKSEKVLPRKIQINSAS